MNRTAYRTVVLSDIHLGTRHSKSRELCQFLSGIRCKKLILNGDIIDGWYLQKKNGKNIWKKHHTDFFRAILKMMQNDGTEIIYIRGNHDDFLDSIALLFPFTKNQETCEAGCFIHIRLRERIGTTCKIKKNGWCHLWSYPSIG